MSRENENRYEDNCLGPELPQSLRARGIRRVYSDVPSGSVHLPVSIFSIFDDELREFLRAKGRRYAKENPSK